MVHLGYIKFDGKKYIAHMMYHISHVKLKVGVKSNNHIVWYDMKSSETETLG